MILLTALPLSISQAKAKGQSSKVNINSTLVEGIIDLDEVKGDMTAVLNALKDDFTRNLSIRTSPGIQLLCSRTLMLSACFFPGNALTFNYLAPNMAVQYCCVLLISV